MKQTACGDGFSGRARAKFEVSMIVVKVGGSLYDHPRLGPGLRAILQALPEYALIVPGGGPFANVVRKIDCVHGLSASASHELALQAMNLAGRFLRELGISNE